MTQVQAGDIMEKLVNLGYLPTLMKDENNNYIITVSSNDGVAVNSLKQFQDQNGIVIKARTADMV